MSFTDEAIEDHIIRRAAVGDRDAQEKIYELFSGRVYRTVQRIVGEADAADVTQDAFLQLYSKLYSFRFDSSFATWLYRLVTNASIQHLRRRGRRLAKTQSLPKQGVVGRNRASSHRELAEVLAVVMWQLEPELRLIFHLKEIDGLTYAQISELVGIPEGTVGSRLNRARRELRDRLLAHGWEA